jgi:hypothetical protein
MMDSKGGEDGPTDFSRRGICRRIACMHTRMQENSAGASIFGSISNHYAALSDF